MAQTMVCHLLFTICRPAVTVAAPELPTAVQLACPLGMISTFQSPPEVLARPFRTRSKSPMAVVGAFGRFTCTVTVNVDEPAFSDGDGGTATRDGEPKKPKPFPETPARPVVTPVSVPSWPLPELSCMVCPVSSMCQTATVTGAEPAADA